MGVDYFQGFYFAKPMPENEAIKFVLEDMKKRQMSMLNCTYENTIKALWEDYLKTDTVDQELMKKIGEEAYNKTHITYMKHNLEHIKNDITKSLIKKGLLTEETYDKLISFLKI